MKQQRLLRSVIVAIALLFACARAGQYFFAFAIEQPALKVSAKMTQYRSDTGQDVEIRHMGKAVEARFTPLQLPAVLLAGMLSSFFLALVLSITALQSSAYSFIPAPLTPGRRLALYGTLRL